MRHSASTHSFLYQAFCYVMLASPPTGLVADDLTEVARSFLYTNREDAISILEKATRESPFAETPAFTPTSRGESGLCR